jgi:type III restriction enzyme
MSTYEVPTPILNSPYVEPTRHWYIQEGEEPEERAGRRPSVVFPPQEGKAKWDIADRTLGASGEYPGAFELVLVNRVRTQVAAWRDACWPGASRTTLELLQWWRRDGRQQPLFFAQLEAAETIIFLNEARADFLQGINVPRETVSDEKHAEGFSGFLRYACKMATGSGKTTVMGMLCAWSILNKVHNRIDRRFSDVVLVVCPNVTIKNRLLELDPERGDASLYVTRDLVPRDLRTDLTRGRVLVTNWHVFQPQAVQTCGVSAKVVKTGVPLRKIESITIGPKSTTARGSRYLTQEDFDMQVAAELLTVIEEDRDKQGILKKVKVESVRYQESDTALLTRVLGREVGSKRNLLIINDESHHAYRILRDETEDDQDELFGEEEDADDFFKEATVWIDGLDKIQKHRGINQCIDLSATPYFLGRVGQQTNRPFPWVVSDFGLVDAIESGLTKIPQLTVRDTTGAAVPGYFNIWKWILDQMTPAERGGKRGSPKPEAVLKYANTPIAMLAGYWQIEFQRSREKTDDQRPPVFIIVCKNTAIAKVLFEWIANDSAPSGIPSLKVPEFRNRNGASVTIRVDSKVVAETDDLEGAKSDESRWMRFTLDTVGRTAWPTDNQGRPVYHDAFEELASKLARPLHPPGRDVRCIVSVGMLTEGWDCNTVTHIVGLRPFMSQLLCEQVVGRGLRRRDYEAVDTEGGQPLLTEEVAQVFGVPFEVIPFKANPAGAAPPAVKRHHVHAIPSRTKFEIRFPRVDGYTQAIRNRIAVNWASVPPLIVDPLKIPPEVQMKAGLPNNTGRRSLSGPGRIDDISLSEWRKERRTQELEFELARALCRDIVAAGHCDVPVHVLFPQLARIVQQYVRTKVKVHKPAHLHDLFLAPYFGWLIERLTDAIRPDTTQGEAPEIPRYESNREPGSTADVDFWTSKEVREVLNSHVNYVVADTKRWEQSAAYRIDTHPSVESFVKNAGLAFAIPYLHNGQRHDYVPDFLIRLKASHPRYLILETKGFDELEQVKRAAAERWVAAVNAEGSFGEWRYVVVKHPSETTAAIDEAATTDLMPVNDQSK